MKRLLSIFLLCAMLVSLLASCAPEQGLLGLDDYANEVELENLAAQTPTEAWGSAWNGSSSSTKWYTDDPNATTFELSTGADLKGFISLVHDETNPVSFEGKTVKLKNHIYLGDKSWTIPASSNYFQGTFDGNNKTIGGFKMTCTVGNQSLLGPIGGNATVKNLTVQKATIHLNAEAATNSASLVISKITTEAGKTVLIDNVKVSSIKLSVNGNDTNFTSSITYNEDAKEYKYVGSIVGQASGNGNVTIQNCSSNATVNGRNVLGGLIGYVYVDGANVTIQNCTNAGNVNLIPSSSNGTVAGIVGRIEGDDPVVLISGCTNTGKISFEGEKSGGCWMGGIGGYLVGTYSSTKYLKKLTIENCTNTGEIVANRTSGGLVGYIQYVKELAITNCTVNANLHFTINSSSNRYVGGLVGAINANNLSYPATITNCKVNGTMRLEDPLNQGYYAGGLVGLVRKSAFTATKCEVAIEFINSIPDSQHNVVLGINEQSSSVHVENLTYIWHNDIPTLDSGIDLADVSYFKYVGQQTADNGNGTTDLRLVFGVGNIQNTDKAIGFDVSIKKLGLDVTLTEKSVYCSTLYTSICGGGKTYLASDFGCNYLYTLTIKNIPNTLLDPVGETVYIKNAILNVQPFSQSIEEGTKHTGFGLVDYVKNPETHVFRFEDFSGARPTEFGTGNGIILSKNIAYASPSNVSCQNFKKMGSNNQYILQKDCICGNNCTAGWGGNGAIALINNNFTSGTPYHYYIDVTNYEKATYFGEDIDTYEAYHTWSFEVTEAGLYEFCFRIRLNTGDNQTRYALVQLDNEPYGDQSEFTYTVNMKDELNGTIRDANHDSYLRGYKRYLTAGTHTITFRVPYDTYFTAKSNSFHFRDIYIAKTVADPANADIPKLSGATLYDGNFDTSVTYVLDNTTESVLNSYIGQLEAAGFELKGEKRNSYQYSSFDKDNYDRNENTMQNKFYLYTNEDYMVYAYYTEGAKAIRVVVDYVSEYTKYMEAHTDDYNEATEQVTTPLFALLDIGGKDLTLSSGKNIKGVTNGMCLVYRLSDGRFIVVDGGFWNTGDTEGEGVARLYDWLQKNDHIPGENNNIVIANWIITHHHSDHISVAHKFEKMYNGKGKVTIQNFMYNFPSYESAMDVYGTNLSVSAYRVFYPKLHNTMQSNNCLVVHTGMTYQFADCSIEILYTHEDYYPERLTSYNNSSTVFKITLAGKTFLVAGDLEEPGQKRAIKQAGTLLESDFLQVTHHGSNGQIEFYKYIVGLNEQSKFNTDTIVIWPLPRGENMDLYNGTSPRAIANAWIRDMFRNANDLANDNIYFAVENWVYTDFN